MDVKTKQCTFICYGQDEFGYLFYDPIDKNLIRSPDVVHVFFEDQAIKKIDKVEKPNSHIVESLVDVDLVPIINTYLHMKEPKIMMQIIIRLQNLQFLLMMLWLIINQLMLR